MKRIFILFLAIALFMTPITANAKGDVYEVAEKHTFTNKDTTLPYRLLLPENYDESKEYPLLVFFHGAGERGNDNELQLFHCVQYLYDNMPEDCIIVAPQCPIDNQWVDTPWKLGAYSAEKVPESNELHAVIELLDELKENYTVDSDRIYAAGISMGGFAVWDIVLRHNTTFAAGIAVCGGGDPSKAEILKDIPLFVFHGDVDTDVPASGTRDTVNAIRDAGGTKIEYTEYTGWAHGIWNKAFSEPKLLEKLLACKLSDRMPKQESVVPEETSTVSESSEVSEKNNSNTAKKAILIACIVVIAASAAVIALTLLKNKQNKTEKTK